MSQDNPSLRRWYGVMLRSYPQSYRRARGLEMLTTLLEAAGPARSRPSLRDSLDLLVGGIRYRFLVPRRPLPVIVATLCALLVGVVVSGGGAWLAWQGSTTLPASEASATTASAAAGTTAGAPAVDIVDPASDVDPLGKRTAPGDEGHDGPAPAPSALHYSFPMGQGDEYSVASQARERLAAAGWQTGSIVSGDHQAVVWATRGDQVVRIFAVAGSWSPQEPGNTWSLGDPVTLWVSVHAVAPRVVTVVAVAGLVIGALIGWLACAWGIRARRRHGSRGRVVLTIAGIGAIAVGGVGILLPTLAGAFGLASIDGWSPADSLLPVAVIRGNLAASIATAILALLAAGAGAAAPAVPDPVVAAEQPSRGARWAVALGTAAVVVCVVATLVGLVAF